MLGKQTFAIFSTLLMLLLAGCRPAAAGRGKMQVVCGLPPVAFIAAQLCGDKAEISSMLPEGRSPHDYSPRPVDIRNAGTAKFFFTTGMNFENSAVRALPDKVEIVDVSKHIRRRRFDDGHGSCDGHGHAHHHDDETALDPHVWLSPGNAEAIAAVILKSLVAADPDNKSYYQRNFELFKDKLSVIDADMKKRLAPYAGREFLVYHPAFGYFADAAGLRQHPLEINGREMTAVQLANVISKAQKENIKVVFVQKQFNPRTAGELARRINGRALPLDPLAFDLLENFKAMTGAIAEGFGGER